MYKAHLTCTEVGSGKTKATKNGQSGRLILPGRSFWDDHQVAELPIVFPELQLESYRKGKVPGWKWDGQMPLSTGLFGPLAQYFVYLELWGGSTGSCRKKRLHSRTIASHSFGPPLVLRAALWRADRVQEGNVTMAGQPGLPWL